MCYPDLTMRTNKKENLRVEIECKIKRTRSHQAHFAVVEMPHAATPNNVPAAPFTIANEPIQMLFSECVSDASELCHPIRDTLNDRCFHSESWSFFLVCFVCPTVSFRDIFVLSPSRNRYSTIFKSHIMHLVHQFCVIYPTQRTTMLYGVGRARGKSE